MTDKLHKSVLTYSRMVERLDLRSRADRFAAAEYLRSLYAEFGRGAVRREIERRKTV